MFLLNGFMYFFRISCLFREVDDLLSYDFESYSAEFVLGV